MAEESPCSAFTVAGGDLPDTGGVVSKRHGLYLRGVERSGLK